MQRNIIKSVEAEQGKSILDNPDMAVMIEARPAQINNWVNNNVTDWAGVRKAFKMIFVLGVFTYRKMIKIDARQKKIIERLNIEVD